MTKGTVTCPHCQSEQARLLSDHLGSVGWCSVCHRPWIASQRPPQPHAPDRKARNAELRAAS